MGEFVELSRVPQPRKVAQLSPEAQGFKAFKARSTQREASRIVDLAFCPISPHRLALVSGTKVSFWESGKHGITEVASVSKFKNLTQCVAWRGDGKLLLVGEASGTCAVIEAENRNVLRRFKGHGDDAVTCASFASADRSRAATGARDGKLRLWDVATCELLLEVQAHSDCAKALAPGPGGPDAWISAGHDGRVKVWDLRVASGDSTGPSSGADLTQRSCVSTYNHGDQIEAGVVFPGGTMYASAGGKTVKLWDLASGAKAPVQALQEAHNKAIMSVSLDDKACSLLTASFDGLAKVHHAATFAHLWTYRLPGPVTCAAWRPGGTAIAIGLDDGQWQLRERKTDAPAKPAAAKSKSYKRTAGRLRGMDAKPASDDEVMDTHRPPKKKLGQADYLLKKFEYRKLVELMVEPTYHTTDSLAVIEELLQRGALGTTLANIGEVLCLGILRLLLKAFGSGDSLQENLVLEALHALLDSNACLQPPTSKELCEAIRKLDDKVHQEMRVQESLFETAGMLETVMNL